jgi:hypothetical protein
MIRRSHRVAAIAAVLCSAVTFRPAAADQVVETFGFYVTPNGGTANILQFDGSPGTLTGIEVEAFPATSPALLNESATVTVPGGGTTTVTIGAGLLAYSPLPASGPPAVSLQWDVSSSEALTLAGGGQRADVENLTPWSAQSQAVDPSFWGQFTGTGTIAFSFRYVPSLSVTAGNAEFQESGSWSGTLQITYTFTPLAAPEPSSLILLATALPAVAAFARRLH